MKFCFQEQQKIITTNIQGDSEKKGGGTLTGNTAQQYKQFSPENAWYKKRNAKALTHFETAAPPVLRLKITNPC